ncbi:DUF6894 family protein [Allosphingosinicella sp.]|uniref:DUF6894 family protein n=1 Tax=Allosphingosinicella sp. TaxID=2823234 RepID=UPI003D740B2E
MLLQPCRCDSRPDNHGVELASISEARTLAVQSAAELIRDRPEVVWAGEEVRVEVTDSSKLVLFTVIVIGVDAPAGNRRR